MSKEELIQSICRISEGMNPEILHAFSREQLECFIRELTELELRIAEAGVDA